MALYMNGGAAAALYCGGPATAAYWGTEMVFPEAAAPEAEWLYQAGENGVTLLLYLGQNPFLTIPSEMGGTAVTALAPTACNYAALKTVRIPAGITVLG